MGVCTNILNILSNGKYKSTVMEHKPPLPEKRICDERIRHMHGVAELMYQYAEAFDCGKLTSKREELYLLGLVHDIGYIDGKNGHEERGMELLSGICQFGSGNILSQCVFWHGITPKEYMKMHNCSSSEIPNELILLWWADMNVESSGENVGEIVGFKGRLEGLKERCGENSKAYQMCKETMDWLVNYLGKSFLLDVSGNNIG